MSAFGPALWVRVNGIGHAFSREIGCRCDRCKSVSYRMRAPKPSLGHFPGWSDPPWRAHTSASILIPSSRNPREVGQHILVDVGAGVVDSLVASRLPGINNLVALLLTHWHPDHVLGLNQLCESLRRFHGSRFRKLPLYCTLETYDYLRDHFAYEVGTALRFHEILAGTSFEIPGGTVRPVGVAHGTVKGAVVYVLQILNQTVIAGWDIDVPTAQVSAGRTNVDVFREDVPKGAELLLMPANTWRAIGTGHTSFLEAVKYLEASRPKTVAFVHLSGHEDLRTNQKTGYGWTDRRWVHEIGKFAAEQEKFPRVVPVFQGTVLEVPVAVSSTPVVPGS